MWTSCPVILDEPVKILGLEPEDFGLTALTPLLGSFIFDALTSFGCGLAMGAFFYFAKRGKPPGAWLHTLHSLELARLPGILPPTSRRYSPW